MSAPQTNHDIFVDAYQELRSLAGQLMSRERKGHTLSATALTNEAFLRLERGSTTRNWDSRAHFISAGVRAMQHVLVDHARAKSRQKRSGNHVSCEIEKVEQQDSPDWDLLIDVESAIAQLADADPLAAEFARLRFYGGQNIIQTGKLLGLRKTTAYAMWDFIESWFVIHRGEERHD